MFARFDENPAMTLEDIKETKRYRRTDGRTHGQQSLRGGGGGGGGICPLGSPFVKTGQAS